MRERERELEREPISHLRHELGRAGLLLLDSCLEVAELLVPLLEYPACSRVSLEACCDLLFRRLHVTHRAESVADLHLERDGPLRKMEGAAGGQPWFRQQLSPAGIRTPVGRRLQWRRRSRSQPLACWTRASLARRAALRFCRAAAISSAAPSVTSMASEISAPPGPATSSIPISCTRLCTASAAL